VRDWLKTCHGNVAITMQQRSKFQEFTGLKISAAALALTVAVIAADTAAPGSAG